MVFSISSFGGGRSDDDHAVTAACWLHFLLPRDRDRQPSPKSPGVVLEPGPGDVDFGPAFDYAAYSRCNAVRKKKSGRRCRRIFDFRLCDRPVLIFVVPGLSSLHPAVGGG
jgi:hypothetical protein